MAIVKEWTCAGHGDFESPHPVCPHGCTIVAEREFRTAPAYHNGKTKRVDSLVRSQVESFGLSNIRSAREGEASRIQSPAERKMAEFQASVHKRYPKLWGSIPKEGVPAALTQYGAPAENNLRREDTASLMETGKRKTEYIKDPQNLKVDVSKAA